METSEILDTSVAMTRKEGVITIFTLIEFPPSAKRSFDILLPELEDYAKAAEISGILRTHGSSIGAIDILLASMCLNRFARLLTKDYDFMTVKKFFPDFQVELL